MIFGRWTPLGAFGAALLFCVVGRRSADRDQVRAADRRAGRRPRRAIPTSSSTPCRTSSRSSSWPGVVGRSIPPAADGQPYEREGGPEPDRATERDRAARAMASSTSQEGRGPVPVLDDAGDRARPARDPADRGHRRVVGPGPAVVRRVPRRSSPRLRLRADQPERARGPRACRPSATLAEAVAATGPFDIVDVFRRSELCVPHAAEAVATGRALPVAAARRRQLGGGRDRRGGRPAVVMDRCTAIECAGAPDRRALARSGSPIAASADEEARRRPATSPTIAIAGPDLGLPAEDRHRAPRRPSCRVVADAAAPGLVAGDVRVLLLERLVARPRPARPHVADADAARPRRPTGRG